MLCFDKEVARELGVNAAVVVQQLHYWTTKGFGRSIKGRVYIYNTYEQWQEQFAFMSLRTVNRVFKKLEADEIVFTYRKGYDRTSHWSLNYDHPIVSKWHNGLCQVGTMDHVKVARSVHTLTKDNNNNLQHVGFSKQTTSQPSTQTRTYRDDYKEASNWLKEKSKDFQRQASEYADYHCNSPTTKYPQALKMKIFVEIWKKYTGQINHTDFEYVDKQNLRPSKRQEVVLLKKDYTNGYEEEMEKLYLQGEA